MELKNQLINDAIEIQVEFFRELSAVELTLIGGGMGSVVFDD